MIPLPHGGRLVDTQLSPRESDRRWSEVREMPRIWPEFDQLLDAEKIGIGAYSPLEGFMDEETLDSVVQSSRLRNGLPWTIPVLLTPPGVRNRRAIDALRSGDEVALLDARDRLIGVLRLSEKHELDRSGLARGVYRTTDLRHPNVADLQRTGDIALAGRFELVSRVEHPMSSTERTPTEVRELFRRRHWQSVAGYQTRNVPHLAHEYLQRLTLEREEIDGLFIHPLVGRVKEGDYRPEVVMGAYDLLVRNYLPADRVLLAPLSIAMRYAGPRAALFLAILRKNYGCSHYIVGRDQAGVGGFYDPYDAHRIFDEMPVGIVPIRYRESFFCRRCAGVASPKTCPHGEADRESTSQTRIRTAIRDGSALPTAILRPEIARFLAEGDDLLTDGPTWEPRSGVRAADPDLPPGPLAAGVSGRGAGPAGLASHRNPEITT